MTSVGGVGGGRIEREGPPRRAHRLAAVDLVRPARQRGARGLEVVLRELAADDEIAITVEERLDRGAERARRREPLGGLEAGRPRADRVELRRRVGPPGRGPGVGRPSGSRSGSGARGAAEPPAAISYSMQPSA